MQTKKHSILETIANLATGFCVAWILAQFVIPLFDSKNFSVFDGFVLTTIFTVVSAIRSYTWRRAFNRWAHKKI